MAVYFVQAGEAGPIKIGFARDVYRRLNKLRSDSPLPLVLLAMTPGDQLYERELHERFHAHRQHREWFGPAPELLDFIATLPKPERQSRSRPRKAFERPTGRQWTIKEMAACAGSVVGLAKIVGRTHSTVCGWAVVPSGHARAIHEALGIPLHEIRPDLWAPPRRRRAG